MEVFVERCCGLDVHQAMVVACVLVGKAGKRPKKEIRTYGTMTRQLEELRDWLKANDCTHVAMESTGVYWMPVYSVLEDHFDLTVGNAQHMKNVPGRKTDVKDAEWIAVLMRHGLIEKSFVPPKPIRVLRALLRYRTKLVQLQTGERNRLLKLLETANIKLASVATNVFGVSGMSMLQALVDDQLSPKDMAQMARGRLRSKQPQLQLALEGKVEEHHRFLLKLQIRRLEELAAELEQLDAQIKLKLEPYAAQVSLLDDIPGVDWVAAAVIIAETGADMSAFHSASHLASWAGVCPGNNESAGKRRSSRATKGNAHLRTILVQAAMAASRTKGTYFKDKFFRLKARRGAKRAALAIAHKILTAAYHMLSTGELFRELGEAYLDHHQASRTKTSLVRRLERLGYEVTLNQIAAP